MSTEHLTNEELTAMRKLAEAIYFACKCIKAGKIEKTQFALNLYDIVHDLDHEEGLYKIALHGDAETPEQEEA